MSKLPAFQFYPGDWRKDPGVQSLSYHDRGIWFEILLLMHESDERGKLNLNGKPMPIEALARLLGLDNQNLTTTLTCLLEFGVASRCEETGSLVCRRMLRDENLRNIRKECGKLGGNPNLVKQKSTPSSSSSDEDGVLLVKPKRKRARGADGEQLFDQFWNIYPNKVAKGLARKAWKKATSTIDAKKIIAAAERFKKESNGKDNKYIKHPATWLNAESWEDEAPKKKDPFWWTTLPQDERDAVFLAQKHLPSDAP